MAERFKWREGELFVYPRTGEPLPRRGDPALLMAHNYGEQTGAWRAQHHRSRWNDSPYKSAWRQFVTQFPDEDLGMLFEWYFHGLYSVMEAQQAS